MTLPPVIRIFFAIDLPDENRKQITSFISGLKKRSKSNAIRWTKSENLHITLQFLAEVQSEHLPILIENVRAHIKTVTHHKQITFGMLHLFPNPYRPRVIVLDVSPQDHLADIASKIGAGITQTNYPVETRPYRGHLTLGRIKHSQGVNLNFLAEVPTPIDIEPIALNEVILFRSEPYEDGSRYIPMERIQLSRRDD